MTSALEPTVTYAADAGWRRYQPFMPAAVRLDDESRVHEEFWSWRGHRVHLDRMRGRPTGAAPCKVILVHGAGGNGRMLNPYAVLLADAGYDVVAPDFPGFGLTLQAPCAKLAYGVWVDLLVDLVRREAAAGVPVVLFGLSIGGTTAYHAAAREPLVAGVIATTLLDLRDAATREAVTTSRFLARIGGWIAAAFPRLTDPLPVGIRFVAPLAKMSRDAGLSKAIADDPRIGRGFLPARFWRTLSELAPAKEPEVFSTPLLLAHPAADLWTDVSLSRRFFDRIGGPKRVVLLDNASHFPLEEPGLGALARELCAFVAACAGPRSPSSTTRAA
jgi:alpha-beta hydrolase superfamily lysophospholipase